MDNMDNIGQNRTIWTKLNNVGDMDTIGHLTIWTKLDIMDIIGQ